LLQASSWSAISIEIRERLCGWTTTRTGMT
jgi:hypothetical protein